MMEAKQSIWKITLLAIFIASLGAAGTSLGLIQANTQNGAHCKLFVSETQARNFNLHNYNIPTCKLSLAGATIATASIALLTVIEIVKVVSQTTTKLLLPVKITQVILLILAIISLFTTTFVVSAGWAKTCKTYKDIGKSTDAFSCTGYQDNSQSPPHGGEIIASAACAGVGIQLIAVAMFIYVLKEYQERVQSHYQPQIDEEFRMEQGI